MYCPECSAENTQDARFCGECGNSLAPAPQPVRAVPDPVVRVDDAVPLGAQSVSPGLRWGVLAATLLVPFIGVGMGLYYMTQSDASADKKAVGQQWLWVGLGWMVILFLLSSEGY